MEKVIKHPYWSRDDKKQVVCQFHYEDGSVVEAAVMNTSDGEPNNPDWDLVMESFTLEDIDALTAKMKKADREKKERLGLNRPRSIEELRQAPPNETTEERRRRHKELARAEEEEKQQMDRQKNEMLFQAKLEAFEIDEIKGSMDRQMKSKIRRAKNLMQVQAYAAALIMKESVDAEEQQ